MKNLWSYVLYGVLGILIIGFILSFTGLKIPVTKVVDNNQVRSTATGEAGFRSISTGTTDNGDISVELTPKGVVAGVLTVKASINTHSVDMSGLDLKKITTLEYDGKSISPTSAPPLNGHHINGDITFNVNGDIKAFTISIKGIPKVQERVFEWL